MENKEVKNVDVTKIIKSAKRSFDLADKSAQDATLIALEAFLLLSSMTDIDINNFEFSTMRGDLLETIEPILAEIEKKFGDEKES